MENVEKTNKGIIRLTHVVVTPSGRQETPFTEEETKQWIKEHLKSDDSEREEK